MVRGPQAVCASASRDVARRAQRTPLAVFEPASCGHVQSQGLPAKDTQAIRAHFRLRASLSCGHVQLPRLLWPRAEPSPAVKRHAGHHGTLRYTRLLSCGHVQLPRLHVHSQGLPAKDTQAIRAHFRFTRLPVLWPCTATTPPVAMCTVKSCREKTRRPSGHTALYCAACPAHVDPQLHVRPTTPD